MEHGLKYLVNALKRVCTLRCDRFFVQHSDMTDFPHKICYDFMHWLQNPPLRKEAKPLIATNFHGMRVNNCLVVFHALTQERNVSGSKKIGP